MGELSTNKESADTTSYFRSVKATAHEEQSLFLLPKIQISPLLNPSFSHNLIHSTILSISFSGVSYLSICVETISTYPSFLDFGFW